MAKQSRTIIQRFQRLYFHSISSRPTTSDHANLSHRLFPQSLQNPTTLGSSEAFPTGFLIPNRLSSETSSRLTFHGLPSKSMSQNGNFPHLFSSKPQTSLNNFPCGLYSDGFSSSRHLVPKTPSKLFSFEIGTRAFSSKSVGSSKSNGNSFGTRFFSLGRSASNKLHANAAQAIFDKPVSAVKALFARYREAIGLHIEALWKRYYLAVVGAVGVALCLLLWRIMFSIASTFVGLSEGMAKYGFLALASAIVAFLGLYMRSRFTINPERVYRIAMRKLNTSAGILEVMGAPLSGTELRAYVMSGGGLRLKNFKLRLSGKRCFLIFPIRGSERKGLVSVEVKKKKGQYDMKLLAVDIPMATGPDQRLFLIGNEEEYQIGGGLVSELRDPVVKAMAAEKEFDALDQKEEEEDAKRELQEAEQKHILEKEKLEKGSS